MAFFPSISFSDGAAYGGRHEIAIDGVNGSIRHVHNWNNNKNRDLFFDFQNHDKFFSSKNDFSFVEFIDRRGKVQFHFPSTAYTKLWSYRDSIYVGLSNIMLYNPYQIVVWDSKGNIIYKAHFSSHVAKFTPSQLNEFKEKFPKADSFLKKFYFTYQSIEYCDFSYLGVPNEIGKDAWQFLFQLRAEHPYIKSSESVSNWIDWYDVAKNPEIDGNGNLIIHLYKGDPLVVKLPDKLTQTNAW